jgi:hypothetical protein
MLLEKEPGVQWRQAGSGVDNNQRPSEFQKRIRNERMKGQGGLINQVHLFDP